MGNHDYDEDISRRAYPLVSEYGNTGFKSAPASANRQRVAQLEELNAALGPAIIKKAWQAGLVVVAEVEGFPHPVAAQEVRWGAAGVLEVKTLEGYRIPSRLYTRASAKGLDSTGLLVGEGE